jgi:hypothetical protein
MSIFSYTASQKPYHVYDSSDAQVRCQLTCKPGSVGPSRLTTGGRGDHSSLTGITAGLMQPTRMTSLENRLAKGFRPLPRHPYLVLLPVGFAVPSLLPGPRCALTAPFHPYSGRSRSGLLSVALSLGSPPAAVSRHRISMEPGLSSPTETGAVTRSTGEAHMAEMAVARQALAGSWRGAGSFMMRW